MMNTEQYREHIEYTFNAFCKIVLYHAALDTYKKIRRKQQFEVSLDYLREFDFEPVTTTDEYFVKYIISCSLRNPAVILFFKKICSVSDRQKVCHSKGCNSIYYDSGSVDYGRVMSSVNN